MRTREYRVNGWVIERRPNTFAERWAWEATAVDADGYRTARKGFNTLREAKAFCAATDPAGNAARGNGDHR